MQNNIIEQYDFSKESDEQLLQGIADDFLESVQSLAKLAARLREAEKRSIRISVANEMLSWLRKAAAGQVMIEIIHIFRDQPRGLALVGNLPLADQRMIVERESKEEKEGFAIVVREDKQFRTRNIIASKMSIDQMRQVFKDGRIVEPEAQLKNMQRKVKQSFDFPDITGVSLDPVRKTVNINGMTFTRKQIIRILAVLG